MDRTKSCFSVDLYTQSPNTGCTYKYHWLRLRHFLAFSNILVTHFNIWYLISKHFWVKVETGQPSLSPQPSPWGWSPGEIHSQNLSNLELWNLSSINFMDLFKGNSPGIFLTRIRSRKALMEWEDDQILPILGRRSRKETSLQASNLR